MPVDPADYPETTRGYPYPTLINAGGAETNAETDVPADLKRLADAVDADVTAVEAAAGTDTGTVASDLAAHVADSTGVHGIADTSVLVTTARTITAGTGLTGGGTLAADRTVSIASGGVGTTELANDAVTTAKIAAGAVGTTDIADSAVTDGKLAGSITPSKVTGTAVVQARTITAGTGLSGGGDLSADRTVAIAAGGVGTTQLADLGVTDGKLAGSITPSKVTGTAVVQTVATTKGDLPVRGASALERLPVGVAGTNPILTPDTTASGGLAWKSHAAADVVTASEVGNLLAANVATGTDTLGTTAGFFASGATLASSTDQALVGTKSLEVTMTGTDAIIYTPGANTLGAPVSPGTTYTAQAALRSSAARSTYCRIVWYTSAGATISSANGDIISSSTSAWTLYTVTAVAPATAAYAAIIIDTYANTAGDVHYLDCWGFWRGAGGLWQPPGVPVPNLGSRANPADATQVQIWNPGNATWITV